MRVPAYSLNLVEGSFPEVPIHGVWALAIGFRARVLEGTPDPADDVAEARWIGAEEVDGVDFAWEHDRGFVRTALAQRG